MYIGEFIVEMTTTRDTLRYYIDEKMLLPEKKNGKYWFTEKEREDFEGIRELRELGFTIKMIQAVLNSKRAGCGSQNHVIFIHELIQQELKAISEELVELQQRQQKLTKLSKASQVFIKPFKGEGKG